jgi:superfamily II DNA or RNA helicase
LYEVLVSAGLADRLAQLDEALTPVSDALLDAEAADRLALHLSQIIEREIRDLPERERAVRGAEITRALLRRLTELTGDSTLDLDQPVDPASVLRSISERRVDGSVGTVPQPLIPLLDTTLLTNAPSEPRVGQQLLTEIESADRIDLLVAFVRRSGISPFIDALRRHCAAGRRLRVLTTTYTNSTEQAALDLLQDLGAEVRVSYDTTTTRLHAKAWIFHRDSGFSTTYVGSSNLTFSAQVTGLEWNVRLSGARNPTVLEKMDAVVDSYWESEDFRPYDAEEFATLTEVTDKGPTLVLAPFELRPEPFQERLLEQIAIARHRGRHHNLLVSATGTGKTVMAALDYKRLREQLPRHRLLFVAHREEILDQSLATFRYAVRDPAFGEKWVGGKRPTEFEHVFASIQSLSRNRLEHLPPDHFDIVIVDEFHHAAAKSYAGLLDHVKPQELLGLTATPERADGLPILQFFDNQISAELRLWDAIDQHRLTPFLYYGIYDGLDLRDIPWRRGHGYDTEGLTNLYTGNDRWATQVIREVVARVDEPSSFTALGFCVSVDHAHYMARRFNEAGVAAVAVSGETPQAERQAALTDLAAGRVRVVFSVDLFNEGVDVPVVDTLLLLRPTDSPTLFLQQLGRGLRRSENKAFCTVLDFVGQHRKEFRFDRKLRALLGGTRKDLERQVEQGFPYLPAGCHMELDRVASDVVLRSIRDAVPSQWKGRVDELRRHAGAKHPPTLRSFLDESGVELDDIYSNSRSWSDLKADAGLEVHPEGPNEVPVRRAIGRLLHMDDEERASTFLDVLGRAAAPLVAELSVRQRRLVRMLVSSLLDQAVSKDAGLQEGVDHLWQYPQVRAELLELLPVLADRIDHLGGDLDSHPDVPLHLHARYTRREILAAFGVGDGAKVAPWQTGVYWAPDAQADLFAFTLDKTAGSFSPTTRYRDYAISRELIHWESQGATRADSKTGRRYREQEAMGTSVMLFCRERVTDNAFWFLGPATYVNHVGERPMAITWRLSTPLPGDLYTTIAAAVA